MKAVIFDMDGVILDSESIYIDVLKNYLRKKNIKTEDDNLIQYIGLKGEVIAQKIVKNYDLLEDSETFFKKQKNEYQNAIKNDNSICMMDGLQDYLTNLKQSGIKIALASSSLYDTVSLIIDKFNIRCFFDVIVTGEQVMEGKPSPDIFILTAERFGISPRDCIVFEDSYNGILAGKRAGMRVIGFCGSKIKQNISIADYEINSFVDLNYAKTHAIYKKISSII